jgi:hypothetical protein
MPDLYAVTQTPQAIMVGEYGLTLTFTLTDSDGDAQDVSAYDGTKTLVLRAPHNRKTLTLGCTFSTDGSDGIIGTAFTSDSYADIAGDWQAQFELADSGASLLAKSYPFTVEIQKSLR